MDNLVITLNGMRLDIIITEDANTLITVEKDDDVGSYCTDIFIEPETLKVTTF